MHLRNAPARSLDSGCVRAQVPVWERDLGGWSSLASVVGRCLFVPAALRGGLVLSVAEALPAPLRAAVQVWSLGLGWVLMAVLAKRAAPVVGARLEALCFLSLV